jgi:hypothetical protein
MKNFILIFILVSIPVVSFAVDRSNISQRDTGAFAGVGFGYSSLSLQPENSQKSNFQGWNGLLEGGFVWAFTDDFGMIFSGEYKLTDSTNTLKSSTYMEKAKFTQMNGKGGFYWGNVSFGGGLVKTEVEIKNVSSTTLGQTQTYKGSPKLIFVNYGFEKANLRAEVGGEYIFGNINDNIEYKDISAGVRFFFLF